MSGIPEVRGAIHGKNYVLVRPLVDGTSAVFEARHDRNSGTYVVRLFPPEIPARSEISLRIQSGARLSSLLRHPGIAQVLDFNITGEEPTFVVTEYIAGRSLEDAMAEDGMLPFPLSIDLAGQVVEALRAAHAMGIVHGDLHPGAIRLTKNASGKIVTKLLGFGWGKELRASGRRSGGWTYVSPEQLVPGAQRIDERADQFSLAAIVYEMLAGCSPFSEESTDLADPEARRYRQPHPIAQMVLGLPSGLDGVFRRALSYDPGERFPRLEDFASALHRISSGTTATADGSTRVTWEWPAPSVHTSPDPAESLLTPPLVLSSLVLGITEDTKERTSQRTAATKPSHQADAGTLAAPNSTPAEDSDGVPVSLAASALDSMETASTPPPIAVDRVEASAPQQEALLSSVTQSSPSEITRAPETLVAPEALAAPETLVAPETLAVNEATPILPVAAATVPSEDVNRTPIPLAVLVTTALDDAERTPLPRQALVAAPVEDVDRTPIPFEIALTPRPEAGEQSPASFEGSEAAPPREAEEADLVAEAATLAWIRNERPRITNEASGTVSSGAGDPTPFPITDDTHVASDSQIRSSPVLGVLTPPVILAGPDSWNGSGPADSTLSPLLHPVVAKPRTVTRVLFVAATLAVVLAAVSVMSGMREKVRKAEAGAERSAPQTQAAAAPHRPTTVNIVRAVKPEPAPPAPSTPLAGALVVPSVTQATAEIRNDRTRPLRGHSRHGASRAGGRRDRRGR